MKSESNQTFAQSDGINEIKSVSVKRGWSDIGKKNGWKRSCPKCGREIFYKNKYYLNSAKKKNSICFSCCSKGKSFSYRPKPSLQGENHWAYGKNRKNEEVEKMRKTLTGRKLSFSHRENISKARTGIKLSQETIEKQRIASRERILKQLDSIYGHICYNQNACKYFDKLNSENGWELQHALNGKEIKVIGYSLDAYDKKRNIVVEYDEPRHYDIRGNLKPKDIRRMDEIKQRLGCKFYRYDEKKQLLKEY